MNNPTQTTRSPFHLRTMASKTVVFAALLFLSTFTFVNAAEKFTCMNTTYPLNPNREGYLQTHEIDCPSGYCYMSVKVTEDEREQESSMLKRCATAEEGNNKHGLNLWVKKGDRFVYVCDGKDGKGSQCNICFDDEMLNLRKAVNGKKGPVCHRPYDTAAHSTLVNCYAAMGTCLLITNKDGYTSSRCGIFEDLGKYVEGKCVKRGEDYLYYCDGQMCNNLHACDWLMRGIPQPSQVCLDPSGVHDGNKGVTNCPTAACFVSVSVGADQKTVQRCATVEEASRKHEMNMWIKKVDNYVYVCDRMECNKASDKNLLKEATAGKLVCLQSPDAFSLTACFRKKNYRCVYTKQLKNGRIWTNCLEIEDEDLHKEGKCFKTESQYMYICNSAFCNNRHVCDQLEFGKPSPFDLPPPTPAPPLGQDPMHALQGSNDTLGPVPVPSATSSPKSTGSRSNLSTIVMLVLVVGIYFTA